MKSIDKIMSRNGIDWNEFENIGCGIQACTLGFEKEDIESAMKEYAIQWVNRAFELSSGLSSDEFEVAIQELKQQIQEQ